MEHFSREKLDENLSVLTKRLYDMELDATAQKEKLAQAERERKEAQEKMSQVYRE